MPHLSDAAAAAGPAVGQQQQQLPEERPESADHCTAHSLGERLDITVVTMAGTSRLFCGLPPEMSLWEFKALVRDVFFSDTVHELQDIAKLCVGTRELAPPTMTLAELGLGQGGPALTLVKLRDLVSLRAKGGEVLKVAKGAACMSGRVAGELREHGLETEVPVDVDLPTLKTVLRFCVYHMENPMAEIQKPLRGTDLLESGVSDWDCQFVALPQEELFQVILAANHLDIQSLTELSCAKVATLIKGKNTEEIRKQFNIVNDFTPEEEERVREENRWCEDA